MTTREQIAEFVRKVTVGRVRPGVNYWYSMYSGVPHYAAPLPEVHELGNAFLATADFRALQLGGLLNSPSGALLEEAVALVVPSVLTPEFDLIVAALKYAASRQQGERRDRALAAVGGGFLLLLLFSGLRQGP